MNGMKKIVLGSKKFAQKFVQLFTTDLEKFIFLYDTVVEHGCNSSWHKVVEYPDQNCQTHCRKSREESEVPCPTELWVQEHHVTMYVTKWNPQLWTVQRDYSKGSTRTHHKETSVEHENGTGAYYKDE